MQVSSTRKNMSMGRNGAVFRYTSLWCCNATSHSTAPPLIDRDGCGGTSSVSVVSTTAFSPPRISYPYFRHRCLHRRKPRSPSPICRASSSPIPVATRESEIEVENRKFELLRAVTDTHRGLVVTPDQRSSIEKALVSVECMDAGKPIDLGLLDGTWRLQYTAASDVLILFQSASTLPFLEVVGTYIQVDQVFQKFECRDQAGAGVVRNIVKFFPRQLEEHEGATLLVSTKFSVVSARSIYLQFEEIAIQNINISEELQALLAPAILPRSFLSLQILQFFRSFKAQVLVSSSQRPSVGGLYYLSYLDNNMLLGRAVGGGGVFIFTRTRAFI